MYIPLSWSYHDHDYDRQVIPDIFCNSPGGSSANHRPVNGIASSSPNRFFLLRMTRIIFAYLMIIIFAYLMMIIFAHHQQIWIWSAMQILSLGKPEFGDRRHSESINTNSNNNNPRINTRLVCLCFQHHFHQHHHYVWVSSQSYIWTRKSNSAQKDYLCGFSDLEGLSITDQTTTWIQNVASIFRCASIS